MVGSFSLVDGSYPLTLQNAAYALVMATVMIHEQMPVIMCYWFWWSLCVTDADEDCAKDCDDPINGGGGNDDDTAADKDDDNYDDDDNDDDDCVYKMVKLLVQLW